MYNMLVNILVWSMFTRSSYCLERRSFSQSLQWVYPQFVSSTDQICGYVTADINNALACYDGQYCTTISGFFGCCNSVVSTFTSYASTKTWTYTLTPTKDETTTSTWTDTGSAISYSYQSCGAFTTCYDTYAASTYCTGDCASRTENLLCTNSNFPYCQTLTMAHENPNTTYTAFWCAESEYLNSVLPLYNYALATPIRTDDTITTTTSSTSSSYVPTAYTSTSVTQSSKPAAAAGTITVAPTSTNSADSRLLPHVAWFLLTLMLIC